MSFITGETADEVGPTGRRRDRSPRPTRRPARDAPARARGRARRPRGRDGRPQDRRRRRAEHLAAALRRDATRPGAMADDEAAEVAAESPRTTRRRRRCRGRSGGRRPLRPCPPRRRRPRPPTAMLPPPGARRSPRPEAGSPARPVSSGRARPPPPSRSVVSARAGGPRRRPHDSRPAWPSPCDGPDDWWLAVLWVADADGVVSFRDVAPAGRAAAGAAARAPGPVVRGRAVGADPRGGRPPRDPAHAARPARGRHPAVALPAGDPGRVPLGAGARRDAWLEPDRGPGARRVRARGRGPVEALRRPSEVRGSRSADRRPARRDRRSGRERSALDSARWETCSTTSCASWSDAALRPRAGRPRTIPAIPEGPDDRDEPDPDDEGDKATDDGTPTSPPRPTTTTGAADRGDGAEARRPAGAGPPDVARLAPSTPERGHAAAEDRPAPRRRAR